MLFSTIPTWPAVSTGSVVCRAAPDRSTVRVAVCPFFFSRAAMTSVISEQSTESTATTRSPATRCPCAVLSEGTSPTMNGIRSEPKPSSARRRRCIISSGRRIVSTTPLRRTVTSWALIREDIKRESSTLGAETPSTLSTTSPSTKPTSLAVVEKFIPEET